MSAAGLDADRALQIVARGGAPGAGDRFGSGYLVGGGLVLTAAHVVAGAEAVVVRRVLSRGRDIEAEAHVAWTDAGGGADLAVLRLARPGAEFSADLPAPRFGRVEGSVACEVLGFPLFMVRRDAPGPLSGRRLVYRDSHHAVGSVSSWSGRYGGTLQVTLDPPREDPDPARSPWEGMSGAAVFADGALIGVVCEHYRPEGANRITARPVTGWYDLDPAAVAQLRGLVSLPEPDALAAVGGVGDGRWRGCPYLGLVPYRVQDAQVFYGREDATRRLHRRIVMDHTAGGLIVVTGPSGAGKSSLLNAGLVPALGTGTVLEQAGTWPCQAMTPTGAPLQALAAALAQATGHPPRALHGILTLDPGRAGELVAQALARMAAAQRGGLEPERRPRLVLIVDQFEELFTRVPGNAASRGEREAFVAALHALTVRQPQYPGVGPGVVVVAVRGDFVDRLLEFEPLAAAYEAGPFVVRPMAEGELRRAVTAPAAEAGLTVEPELVDTLVREAREQPDTLALAAGVLPLVSQVMARVWEQSDGRALTMRGYQRVGGLSEAVDNAADEAFRQLDQAGRGVARPVFLRLTLVTGEGRVARRRAARQELYRAAGGRAEEVDRLVEQFAGRRLLVLEDDLVEIAHEALVQAWVMLQSWLDEDRGDHAAYARVSEDAESWWQHGQDPAYLYHGGRLEEIAGVEARWAADPQRYPAPAPAVTRFLEAGQAAEKERQAAQAAALAIERATAKRLRRRLVGLAVVTLLALAAGTLAGFAAEHARHDDTVVRAESAVALSRQLIAEAINLGPIDPYTARQLAAAAVAVSPTTEAEQGAATLLDEQSSTLLPGSGEILSAAFNPAGTVLADLAETGPVRLWNLATQQQVGIISRDRDPTHDLDFAINGVAFNPAGTMLATANADGTVRLWNPTTQRQIGTTITAVPGGVGLANALGTLILQDGAVADGGVLSVAFNPAGTILASADADGTVRLWNPATQRQIGSTITAATNIDSTRFSNGVFHGLAFNPAGTVLATADDDGTVRLWNPATQRQIGATITAVHDGGVESVAFNPAGTVLATAGDDGTIRLWNPATQQQIGATITFGAGAGGLAFNPAGTILASADGDGTVRLWNPATQRQIGSTITADTAVYNGTASNDPRAIYGVAFNPAGTILASADGDGTVRLWNPATQQPAVTTITATEPGYRVNRVAFNQVGTMLATAGDDGTVRLWNPATQQQIGTTITANTADTKSILNVGGVFDVAFNPAGTVLASAEGDGTVKLWNPATRKQIGAITTFNGGFRGVVGIAFNPAGTILATTTASGAIQLWNPTTQRQIGSTMQAPATPTRIFTRESGSDYGGATFNATGTVLASADGVNNVRLWNPATQQQIGTTITAVGNYSGVQDVAFNPNGTILATADADDAVKLWNPATQRQIGSTIIAVSNQSDVKSVAFNPDGTVLATAGDDGTVRLWNPATQQQIGTTFTAGTDAATDVRGGVFGLAFNSDGTILATADGDGLVKLTVVSHQLHADLLLCQQFGLPSTSTWSKYAGASITEPKKCS